MGEAFAKAFGLVFEKGTGIIEKSYKKDEIERDYEINSYVVNRKENRKNLKVFSKKASGAGRANLLLSGASGIGMGVLGIGIPDIVVFTSLMLRPSCCYAAINRFAFETWTQFGYRQETTSDEARVDTSCHSATL